MTPERYQRIGQLFDEALELFPEQRAAWLDQACGAKNMFRRVSSRFCSERLASKMGHLHHSRKPLPSGIFSLRR